ncbi:hypothetical protein DBZ36_11280 [Alginatibacterium sediminis]|uniref:NodB homology domain-containing protein n=1 Tax=Alginatibacterium sediminis TaxID=2164068 RepID=A0A420EB11_9ALTE|nr:hypothetical protein [Alginatibacterium sediminis]RKF17832.1 hypothetical protein DBZ36_11280 [Alginatibacterium sediminis]
MSNAIKLGLRFDIDSVSSASYGLPILTRLLSKYQVRASLFFCTGPDNSGRKIWQQLRPSNLIKRIKSSDTPPINYTADKLRCGLIGDGPLIGEALNNAFHDITESNHEIGVLAWDQHLWLNRIGSMSGVEIEQQLQKAHLSLSKVLGRDLECSAAVGARSSDQALCAKEQFSFRYNSDCYGESIFVPALGMAPQIPVTLPSPKMALSCEGIAIEQYANHLSKRIKPQQLNVLALRVEDLCCREQCDKASELAKQLELVLSNTSYDCVPLGQLLDKDYQQWPIEKIRNLTPPGHEDWISYQASCVSECL